MVVQSLSDSLRAELQKQIKKGRRRSDGGGEFALTGPLWSKPYHGLLSRIWTTSDPRGSSRPRERRCLLPQKAYWNEHFMRKKNKYNIRQNTKNKYSQEINSKLRTKSWTKKYNSIFLHPIKKIMITELYRQIRRLSAHIILEISSFLDTVFDFTPGAQILPGRFTMHSGMGCFDWPVWIGGITLRISGQNVRIFRKSDIWVDPQELELR